MKEFLNKEISEKQKDKYYLKEIKVFAPATVANVGCAFDILGFALQDIGDEMSFRKTKKPGITLINKGLGNLPDEPEKNVAGVVAIEMMKDLKPTEGIEIEIHKKINPGSGMGSSAASASGAAFGIAKLFGLQMNMHQLVNYAMQGEKLASGAEHADNVAPAITGSFALIRGYNPLDIIEIKSPKDLFCTIIHPQIEIKTIEARKILPNEIPLKTAVIQWGNVAGLISGLYQSDYGLIGRSMNDIIIEPVRASLIPGFHDLKRAALDAGALGCSIAGSGPAVFAFSHGERTAHNVYEAFNKTYKQKNIEYQIYISKICPDGTRILI
ncbi:MAG: homoserine kinase [Bacteroidales bacterium]